MSGLDDDLGSDSSNPSDASQLWPTPSATAGEWGQTASSGGWGPGPPAAGDTASHEDDTGPVRANRAHGARRGLRAAIGSVAIAVAVLLGAGLGHLVWTTSHGTPQDTIGGISLPGGPNGFTIPGFSAPNGAGGSGSSGTGTGGPANAAAIAKKVNPALVDVSATFSYQQASGEGTGIVLTSSGLVLTNNHVIEGATSITVTDVGNGQSYSATVVGYDAVHDVAALQLQGASGLATALIGNSTSASLGQPVLAIGNAGGVGGTPTSAGGTISNLNQSVTASDSLNGTTENLNGMIAVTANVQPGDSGGPLVDSTGRVLGIDTAGPAGFSFFSAQTQGTAGYAIPINLAMSIVTQIKSGTQSGSIHIGPTAFLGVLIKSSSTGTGVEVTRVVAGGAAAQAGLIAGDVITSVNGNSIGATSGVSKALIPLHPGDTVSLTWTTAKGHQVTGSAVLQSGPSA